MQERYSVEHATSGDSAERTIVKTKEDLVSSSCTLGAELTTWMQCHIASGRSWGPAGRSAKGGTYSTPVDSTTWFPDLMRMLHRKPIMV